MILAKDLGLTPASIADLGVAAMFHDMGYASRRDGQPPTFDQHSVEGLRVLLRQRGFHAAKVRRLLATVEHHRPVAGDHPTPTLYARILRIADEFDILTRPRPGGALCPPSVALRRMAAAAGAAYDATLMKLFVNRLGAFPPGTALRLADGRTVVSTSGARSPETFERPMCRVVLEADGQPPPRLYALDLAVEGRAVKEVIPPR